MKIAFVVAIGENREIGKDGVMPWHMPADLAHFKRVTMGKPMIMGRKTFESIGRALPGRDSVVLTRDPDWHAEGAIVAHDIPSALREAEAAAARRGVDEIAVIGGGVLFDAMLDQADIIHLTELHQAFEADTWFPALGNQWREISRESHPADERNPIAYDFVLLQRTT